MNNWRAVVHRKMQARFGGGRLEKGAQPTSSAAYPTHVLAAVRALNRLQTVGETMRAAMNVLAVAAPDWLSAWVSRDWFDTYSRPFNEYRLPTSKEARYALAAQIGADGRTVLAHVDHPDAPTWLRSIPAVGVLRWVWLQQFYAVAQAEPMRWRIAEDLPNAPILISLPYDPDARYSKKRETEWVGYNVHLTETCDPDQPHLLTDVQTTLATTPDYALTGVIQAHLVTRNLSPGEHLVDAV